MKSRLVLASLFLWLFSTVFSAPPAAAVEKSGKPSAPALSKAQGAQLAELKKQRAANEASIKQLQAKIKTDADKRAARVRNEKLREQKDKLQDQKDSLSEMSNQDQLQLQQLMDKRSQLEAMISNIMKKSSDTANSVGGNLK